MARERHVLASRVFPVVAAECRRRQVAFSEVDLRWGVSEAEASNGQTLEICLREVDRARSFPPFFIALLGERYGWVPTHEVLSAYMARSDQEYRERIEDGLARGVSATEFELRLALEDVPKGRAWVAKVFRRDPALSAEFARTDPNDGDGTTEDSGASSLAALKDWLDKYHPDVREDYRDLDGFGSAAEKFLLDGLDRLFPSTDTLTPIQRVHLAHRAYGTSRLIDYIADATLDATLATTITTESAEVSPRARRVWVSAPSGYGKSALLAHYATSERDALVLAHYIGAAGDRSLRAWRERVLDELVATGKVTSELPDGDEARWDVLPLVMSEVARCLAVNVVVVLDALNVLDDIPTSLARLDDLFVPEGCCLVVSATPDLITPPRSTWHTMSVPNLEERRRRELIVAHLRRHGRSLDEDLLENLVHDPASAVPLFLRLVLDELHLHADYDSLRERVASLLASGDTGRLFLTVLAEMNEDFAHIHPGLASRAGGLAVASRRGLTYPQLRALLAEEGDPIDPATGQARLTDLVMSPLWVRLGVFSLIDNGRHSLMHAALAAPLLIDENMPAWRESLIAFSEADTGEDIAERAHQLVELADHDRLVQLLREPGRVTALWEEDPALLSRALTLLGAGRAEMSPEVVAIGESWKRLGVATTSDTYGFKAILFLGIWLDNLNFLMLAEAWDIALLETDRANLPPDNPNIAFGLTSLASVYQSQGRLDEAEPLLREAVEVCRAGLSPDDPHIASSLDKLGSLFHKQGRLDEAEPLLREALGIARAASPRIGGSLIASALRNLAALYRDQGHFELAEVLFGEVQEIYRVAHPPSDTIIAADITDLAAVYESQGRLGEAESLFREALDILQTALPPCHPRIGRALNNLAVLFKDQGRFEEAESLLLEAIKIDRLALRPGHSEINVALGNLGALYRDQKRFREAEPLLLEALQNARSVPFPSPPTVAELLGSLGALYRAQKRFREAEPLLLEALEIGRHAWRPGHPKIGLILLHLGILYQDQVRFDEAEPLLVEARKICRAGKFPNYLNFATALLSLALLYESQGRLSEAEPVLLELLDLMRRTLPSEHPDMVPIYSALAALYDAQGSPKEADAYKR